MSIYYCKGCSLSKDSDEDGINEVRQDMVWCDDCVNSLDASRAELRPIKIQPTTQELEDLKNELKYIIDADDHGKNHQDLTCRLLRAVFLLQVLDEHYPDPDRINLDCTDPMEITVTNVERTTSPLTNAMKANYRLACETCKGHGKIPNIEVPGDGPEEVCDNCGGSGVAA